MARINDSMRRIGKSQPVNVPPEPTNHGTGHHERDEEDSETSHDRYRRRQARMADQDSTSSLPIKIVSDEPPKPQPGTTFEGPVSVLAEKYKDPREVLRHMTMGQYMRYEYRDGQIFEGETLIYDGTAHLG